MLFNNILAIIVLAKSLKAADELYTKDGDILLKKTANIKIKIHPKDKAELPNAIQNPLKVKLHMLREKHVTKGRRQVNSHVTKDQVLHQRRLTPRPYRTMGSLRRSADNHLSDKNLKVMRRAETDSSSPSEEYKWKERWKQIWNEKKIQAMNMTTPRGDFVNMVAARPWGKECKDPAQLLVTGTCMLPNECDAEFRIYRGDVSCGNTQFICCGIQQAAYDFYQAFDASFASSEMNTDNDSDLEDAKLSSKEKKKRKEEKRKKERRKKRNIRKKRIKRAIKKIIKQIRKLLNKMKKRGEKARKWKTKQLNRYVKYLKKQYKADLEALADIHGIELLKVDDNLLSRLKIMQKTNAAFNLKKEFRDIVISGYMTRNVARQLLDDYPDLADLLMGATRRNNVADEIVDPQLFDYNIEYGFLYY